MTPPQDEPDVRRAYDTVANTYADHFRSTEPELPVDLALIAHFASIVPEPRRVVDAGCGAGRMLPVLSEMGCSVEGFDVSPEMVRRAQQDHPEFTTQVGSMTAFPLATDSVDGVFCWYSTIHAPDRAVVEAFREARRVLTSGGLLLVAFQTGTGLVDVSEHYARFGHRVTLQRYNRTPELMRDLMLEANFVISAAFSREHAPHERSGQAVLIGRVA